MTRYPIKNFRPEPDSYEAAKNAADNAGYSMNVLLQAFLRRFSANPPAGLRWLRAELRAVASETPPRGRPRATPPGPGD